MKLIQATSQQGWALLPHHIQLKKHAFHLSCSTFSWDKSSSQLPHAISPSLSQYQLKFPNSIVYQGYIKTRYSYFLNLLNMAVKAAWLLGLSQENIVSVLKSYQPQPTRVEMWKTPVGSTLINDIYCSDPQSIDHALKHFEYASKESRKFFVFGSMRERISSHRDYKRIGKAIAHANIEYLILLEKNHPIH